MSGEGAGHRPGATAEYSSKDQLERKLQDARAPSRKNLSNGQLVCHPVIGLTEIDVVEEIEDLRPELQVGALGDLGVLYDSEVRVEKTWAAQNVPARVAKRSVDIRHKNRRVEVLLDQLTMGPAGIELGFAEVCSDKVSAIHAHAAEGLITP